MAVFTQTTTFANGQTADGGQVNTEIVNLGNSVNNIVDAQVGTSANIAISKTALGTYTPWTTWNPTIGASLGFSSKEARYSQIGKIVFIQGYFSGTVTSGTANPVTISLPVAANASGVTIQNIQFVWGNNISFNFIRGFIPSTDTSALHLIQGDDASALNGNAVTAGHHFYFSGFYEAA